MSARFKNPLGSEPPASIVGNDNDEEEEEDPDFSMMGSGLMGASTYIPMSPKERQLFINGMEIRARYVGSIEVPYCRGDAMVEQAVVRVRQQHKLSKEDKPKTRFVISTFGIRIYDEATQILKDTYPLVRISYIMVLPANKKVFAFVTASDPHNSSERIFTAHVYKTSKKTILIKELIGQAFSLAFELKRQELNALPPKEEEKFGNTKSYASATGPRSTSLTTPSSSRPTNDNTNSSGDFAEIARLLMKQIQGLSIGAGAKQLLIEEVVKLDSIHSCSEADIKSLQNQLRSTKQVVLDTKEKWQKTLAVASDLSTRLSTERQARGKSEIRASRALSIKTSSMTPTERPRSSTMGGGRTLMGRARSSTMGAMNSTPSPQLDMSGKTQAWS